MPPRAWLVDLDGTLYHPLPVKLAMAAELVLFGRGAVPTIKAFRAQHEALRAALDGGEELDGTDPFRRQLELAAGVLGRPVDAVEPVVLDWMVRRPGPWLRRFRRRDLLADVASFRTSGGRTAIVSDYPARDKLRALGAEELFEVIVASGEDGGPGRLKPDPAGYLAAAAALGVEPADCLVIGDRDDADGEAARRAGMAFRRVR
jgi:FMN phosphatase YigB (HAD superfamily)